MGSIADAVIVHSHRDRVSELPGGSRCSLASIRLGNVEVIPAARVLRVEGQEVELGGRSFDLLMALLDARGAVVSKEDLIQRVWPAVTVVESNLKVQLSLLRRALRLERWRVKTIPGRGYLLVTDDALFAHDPGFLAQDAPASGKPFVMVLVADDARELLDKTLLELLDGFRMGNAWVSR